MKRPYFSTIWKQVGQAIADWGLIEQGDIIGVGISGGKDSLILAWVLSTLQRIAPVRFEVIGLMVDLGWPADLSGLKAFMTSVGLDFHIRKTNIGPVVFDQRKEKNPCALCAHLRRGALNSLAKEKGCNKVALAHHLDDAIETLLMSMFFEGRIEVFSPKTHLDDTGLTVIRPLVYVEEESIATAARDLAFPVLKSPCPAAGKTRRQQTKDIVVALSRTTPNVRSRLKSCLRSLWAERCLTKPQA